MLSHLWSLVHGDIEPFGSRGQSRSKVASPTLPLYSPSLSFRPERVHRSQPVDSEQVQRRKTFTRSAARHLRRKRLNDARKIEKQLAALTNGTGTGTGTGTNSDTTSLQTTENAESSETISKSKARRLRKKNKVSQQENCCTLCNSQTQAPTENGDQNVPLADQNQKARRRLRKRNWAQQNQNGRSDCNDSTTLERNSEQVKCARTVDAVDSRTVGGIEIDADTVVSSKGQCTGKVERVINHVKDKTKSGDTGQERSEAQEPKAHVVESLEYPSEHSTQSKTENESQPSSVQNSDEIAREKPVTRLTQPSADWARLKNNSEIEDARLGDEVPNEHIGVNLEFVAPMLKTAAQNMTDKKGNISEKSKEEIKAEREAKKAAKAAAKAKAKVIKGQDKENKPAAPTAENDVVPAVADSKKTEIPKPVVVDAKNIKEGVVNATTTNAHEKIEATESKTAGKSKAELRAERRAKQEAQRAAKQQQQQQQLSEKSKPKSREGTAVTVVTTVTAVKASTASPEKPAVAKKLVQKEAAHEVNLFKHLYHERELASVDIGAINSGIHPVIVKLGAEYANRIIVGSNSRCVALLTAVKQLIQDFERPSQADFTRGLETKLQESTAYLHHCRPLAVSMQNAIRHLKWQMSKLPPTLSDIDAKDKLRKAIDTYIREQIELAGQAISLTILKEKKISEGDVILTYGYSTLIHNILVDAHNAEKEFRVIVVDGRPLLEGKEQLKRLTQHGIECSYVLINALSYVMPQVSKVFLGAHAILANGAVMSRVGTAQVALMARAFNVPVLVACETHKSCERGQTDSIVYNELGKADDLARETGSGAKRPLLANWRTKKSLNLLNILYDVTPPDLVTAVVTELAILPCTSVPVILRIRPSEI